MAPPLSNDSSGLLPHPSGVYDATEDCRASFQRCSAVDSSVLHDWAENRLADFNLWAAGVGASAKTQLSLDTRLANEPGTHAVVTCLLLTLDAYIKHCLAVHDVDSTKYLPVISVPNASESGGGDENEVDEMMSLSEAMKGTEELLDELVHIGVVIRRAGTTSRHGIADRSFDPSDPKHEDLHKFLVQILLAQPSSVEEARESSKTKLDFSKDTPNLVQQQLINANLKRRNRFIHARDQGIKLGSNWNRPSKGAKDHTNSATGKDTVQKSEAREGKRGSRGQEQLQSSPSAAGKSSNTKPSDFSGPLFLAVPSQKALSQVSSTVLKIDYPRPPPNAKHKRPFRCPCCWQTQPSTLTERQWVKHIAEDICPYTCIFADCPKGLVLFPTSDFWKTHIIEEHRSTPYWRCFICSKPPRLFYDGDDFIAHIANDHPGIVSEPYIRTLVDIYRKSDPRTIESCPLCSWAEEAPWRAHMLEEHGSSEYWECSACKSSNFHRRGDLKAHVENLHHEIVSRGGISTFLAASPKSIFKARLSIFSGEIFF